MILRKILYQLDIPAQCQRYKIALWQCPQFLFLIMGIIIVGAAITAYLIGTRFIEDPEVIALIVLALSGVLFIFTYVINLSFGKLAEASRLKSEFIRIVSHQLRSPLTNVSWATDILLSGELGETREEQVEYFRILKENNARMRELVKDLLLVSRLEEGALPIRKEKTSLRNVIEDLISKFSPFARASNVEIKFQSEKDLPEVFVDPRQVEIVIETLLDNAIRYIRRRGKVEIYLGKKEENIFFKIKDAGIGIPEEDQKYIFQKFFRSKTAKRGVIGSGLGLFISKSIINRMGGKIWFESEEGKGSTFYFTLPLK